MNFIIKIEEEFLKKRKVKERNTYLSIPLYLKLTLSSLKFIRGFNGYLGSIPVMPIYADIETNNEVEIVNAYTKTNVVYAFIKLLDTTSELVNTQFNRLYQNYENNHSRLTRFSPHDFDGDVLRTIKC